MESGVWHSDNLDGATCVPSDWPCAVTLYRASPGDGVAWITGASSGIGRLLALELAAEGYSVAASARDEEQLASLVEQSAGLKGRISSYPCDVTDRDAVAATVGAIEQQTGPIVLAVFNAGSYFPAAGEDLDVDDIVKTYEVNLFGVVHGLVPVVRRMHRRGAGQVVLVGSVTSYFGLPTAAAYGATKAALNNMAEALKFDFDKMNIRIQVMNPGFVDTPATRKNTFPMPALMPAGKAAKRMAAGIRSGGFEVTFPRRFTWILKVVRLLPHPLQFAILNRAMGWDKRPLGTAREPRD